MKGSENHKKDPILVVLDAFVFEIVFLFEAGLDFS
jgi:hypothetical protein